MAKATFLEWRVPFAPIFSKKMGRLIIICNYELGAVQRKAEKCEEGKWRLVRLSSGEKKAVKGSNCIVSRESDGERWLVGQTANFRLSVAGKFKGWYFFTSLFQFYFILLGFLVSLSDQRWLITWWTVWIPNPHNIFKDPFHFWIYIYLFLPF